MEKSKYFNCKKRDYIIPNYLEKAKVFIIKNSSNINNIENIDQRKKKLLSKIKKEA